MISKKEQKNQPFGDPQQNLPVQAQDEKDTTLIQRDTQHTEPKSYPMADASQSVRSKIATKFFSEPEFGTVRSGDKDSIKADLINLHYKKQYSEIIRKCHFTNCRS